ncbi:MAG: hypothetical protein WCS37_04270 [Chloroflexota bacterium]
MIDIIGCVDPDKVTDTDYLALINKDGRAEFDKHLRECPYCQNEVALYRKFDSLIHKNFRFLSSSKRLLCLETQKVGEYALGLLGGIEERNVAAHLEVCSLCQEEFKSLQAWLPEEELAPTPISSNLQSRGVLNTPSLLHTPDVGNWLRKVIATLITPRPSLGGFALAGVRGNATERTPQVFQAEEVQVTLMVQQAGPRCSDLLVEGLVQRLNTDVDDLEGAPVRLLKDAELLATEVIDDIGNFVFESVRSCKTFDLEITLSDKIVLVQDIITN